MLSQVLMFRIALDGFPLDDAETQVKCAARISAKYLTGSKDFMPDLMRRYGNLKEILGTSLFELTNSLPFYGLTPNQPEIARVKMNSDEVREI